MDFAPAVRAVSYRPMAHITERLRTHYLAMHLASDTTTCDDPRAVIGQLQQVRPTPSSHQLRRSQHGRPSSSPTDERRRDARAALAALAEPSAAHFPLASSALRDLLAEPVPDEPARDELWVSLVVGLAHEQLEDALGAPLAL